MSKQELARQALAAALKLRQQHNIELWEPISIYDLAQDMGIEVRFLDVPSLEEIYLKTTIPRKIIVSSLRPSVRQVFNCAHGIGHSVFNHGDTYHELAAKAQSGTQFDSDEFLADTFAGFLLMPKVCVSRGFADRGLDPKSSEPSNFYAIACWLGVGYSTLIDHMVLSLRMLSLSRGESLKKLTPKQIRSSILGYEITEDLIIVDSHWGGRAIDVQVGDLILLPAGTESEGQCITFHKSHPQGVIFQAISPGIGRVFHWNNSWAGYVRVAKRDFVGRACFRHLEDPDYEQSFLH